MLNFQNSQHKRQRKGREGFAFCIGMSLVADKTSEPYTKLPPAPAPAPAPPPPRGKKKLSLQSFSASLCLRAVYWAIFHSAG